MTTLEFRIPQQINLGTEIPGPKSRAMADRQKEVVAGVMHSYVDVYPADMDGGIIEDIDGNRFIDFVSGIAVTGVGASAPEVVAAVQEQVSHFTHTCVTSAFHPKYVEVCERLVQHAPITGEKRVILTSTGAEAVENAVKIARTKTGRPAVVVFENAYHGRTNLTLAMTTKAHPYKEHFGPFAPEVYRVPGSYPFRDGLSGAEAAARTIQYIETRVGAESVAAVVIEPIQGEGGFIVPAEGYMEALRGWCDSAGAILIFDEIQAGVCRSGRWFSSEWFGVEPDLMTVAKGIAGGLPLSGVIGRREVMESAPVGGIGSGTYGGNPVACAAAVAALDKFEAEHLDQRALKIESVIRRKLAAAQSTMPEIGEIRGHGAMIAIELVQPGTKEPNAELVKAIVGDAYKHGLFIIDCGVLGNSLRILPPLVIPFDLLEVGLDILVELIETHR